MKIILLIFHDVFNLETEKYFFRVFTEKGEELDYSICSLEDIIIKEIKYNIQRPENVFKIKNLNDKKCMQKNN